MFFASYVLDFSYQVYLDIAAVLFSTLIPVTAAADDDKDEDVIFILTDKIDMPGLQYQWKR